MMIRSIALPGAMAALVAAGVFYAASQPGWRTIFAVWPGASDRAPETKLATEDWPICTTMAAMGSEADWTELDPDFAAGKKALVAEDWTGAIAALKLAAVRDPYNADIQNYIGYAYRRLRQLGPAMQHYQQALVLNRRHRSAHEHLGEMYLVLGDAPKAEQQLAILEDICLIPCIEPTISSARSLPTKHWRCAELLRAPSRIYSSPSRTYSKRLAFAISLNK